jgi:hypothetical protein
VQKHRGTSGLAGRHVHGDRMDTANIGRDVVLNAQKSAEASVVTA